MYILTPRPTAMFLTFPMIIVNIKIWLLGIRLRFLPLRQLLRNRCLRQSELRNRPIRQGGGQEQNIPDTSDPRDKVRTHYVTSAGKFVLDATIDDLSKARDLLRRFEKGGNLRNK